MNLYQSVSRDLLAGRLPYRDRIFEYPPYAIPFLLLPRLFCGNDSYPIVFMLTVLLSDWLMKLLLIGFGIKHANTFRCFLPLLFYALPLPAIRFFYLQRYDIWPAMLSVSAILLFGSRRFMLSAVMLALGIGVKAYPAVLFVPLLFFSARLGQMKRFSLGFAMGLLPMLILGLFLPWWRFAEFQNARGLQVESLYASVLWLGKLLHMIDLKWVYTKAWFEVKGTAVDAMLPWVRMIFAFALMGATLFALWAIKRLPVCRAGANTETELSGSIPQLSRILLIPLLAFVAFNQVLSPQYMIWILPLAALGSLDRKPHILALLPIAAALTPLFFPVANYITGLSFFEIFVLILRNLMLIATEGWLIWDIFRTPGVSWNKRAVEVSASYSR